MTKFGINDRACSIESFYISPLKCFLGRLIVFGSVVDYAIYLLIGIDIIYDLNYMIIDWMVLLVS